MIASNHRWLRAGLIPVCALIMTIVAPVALAAPAADLWPMWNAEGGRRAAINHSPWQQLLDRYLITDHVSGVNRFDYASVTVDHKAFLEKYLKDLQSIDPRQYRRAEQFAYWVNLYNAVTVQLVLQAYPVASIRDIGGGFFSRGPWGDDVVSVAGEALTLNDIEHRILRPIWRDPRIHFAVNCASIGCPDLAPQAFTAGNTEALLTQAAKAYLAHERGARFSGNTLVLSKIFDWYQTDFGRSEQAMLNTISQYAGAKKAVRMQQFNGRIKYEYNWSLNKP